MKRYLFLVILFVIIQFSSYGQFKGGLKGGANFSRIIVSKAGDLLNDESFGTRASFHLGSYMANTITDHVSWQLEVLFSNKGYKHKVDDKTVDVSLNYLNWPLLLIYQPIQALEFEFGPEFGYMIIGEDILNSFDLGIDLGARVNFNKKLNAGIRYNYGFPFKLQLDQSGSNEYEPTYQNSVFQIYVGFNLINELSQGK